MKNSDDISLKYSLSLADLPRFLKPHIIIPDTARSKDELDRVLVEVLEEFFQGERLSLDPYLVHEALKEVTKPGAQMILSKLRSLLEKQARRDIGDYCGSLNKERRGAIARALNRAGIHHFRENLETDLYVGIHTAVSANFKMMGVVYCNSAIPENLHGAALDSLFRVLRFVAAQPLGVLLSLEGLFWDRGLYSIPASIYWREEDGLGSFYLDSSDIENRLKSASITEIPTGCPAMRARTPMGERAIDFVQQRCLEVVKKYFLDNCPKV